MAVMTENDNGWGIHKELFDNLRRLLRDHQRRLIQTPDPSDPWWFLVDPEAADNPWD